MSKKLKDADPTKVAREFRVSALEWFAITDSGVVHVVKKDAESDPVAQRLTFSRFEIVGFLEPLDDDASRGLRIDLGTRKITVPRADLAKRDQLASWLSAHGVLYNPEGVSKLLKYIAMWDGDRLTAYTKTGWQKNRAFVVGERVINGEGVALMPSSDIKYSSRGSYQEWREQVLARARQKPGWVLGILHGLSSPILARLNAPNSAFFNFANRSRTGKTYALMAGAGCWGLPTPEGCLRSFNATVNATEGWAQEASDVGLFLDELAKEISKKGGPEKIQNMIYMIANGQGKGRMLSSSSMRETKAFRCNVVVSSEKTIQGLFELTGQQQAAGQVIRAFDMTAPTLFPDLPFEAVREFHEVLTQYYGTAGPELVKRVLECDDLDERFMRAVSSLYAGEDGLLQSAAAAWAPSIVAGELLEIETDVVAEAFSHWMTEGVDEALDDGFQSAERLLDFIEARKGVTLRYLMTEEEKFDGSDGGEVGFSSRDRDGWFDREENVAYLRTSVLRGFADGMSSIRFYDWLIARRIMDKPSVWRDRGQEKKRYTTRIKGLGSGVRIDVTKLERVIGR